MKKTLLAGYLFLNSSIVLAAEDSYTLLQTLVTMQKLLESTDKALELQQGATARLAVDTWRNIGGSTAWEAQDGSMGLSLIGDMSQISFNSGSQSNTVSFNAADAINAIQNKGSINIGLANQVVNLQTQSIANDAAVLNKLAAASKTPKGQLEALQVLLQISIQNLQQMRHMRSQIALDSQYRINEDRRKLEIEKANLKKRNEIMRYDYKPASRSAYKGY